MDRKNVQLFLGYICININTENTEIIKKLDMGIAFLSKASHLETQMPL